MTEDFSSPGAPEITTQQAAVPELSASTTAFLDRLRAMDPEGRLADPSFRAARFGAATPDEIVGLLQGINTVLYGSDNPLFDKQIVLGSGQGEGLKAGYVGPGPADAKDAFGYALTEAQQLVGERGAEALEAAAGIVSGAIAGTQMFHDGNKRTARAAELLLGHGFDGSPEDMQRYELALGDPKPNQAVSGHRPDQMSDVTSSLLENTDATLRYNMLRFDAVLQQHLTDRGKLDAMLASNIDDPGLRRRCVSVLQQRVYGAYHLAGLAGGVPEIPRISEFDSFYNPPEQAVAPVLAIAGQAIATITPAVAEELVARDSKLKSDHLKRLVDSSSGKRPLPYIGYDGQVSPSMVVTI